MPAAEEFWLRLDAALRGGAVALVVLTAWRLATAHGHSTAARFGVAFSLTMAVYFAFSSPALHPFFRPANSPVVVVINQGSVLFWWFALALFDDRFRWRWWLLGPAAFILVLSVAGQYLFPQHRIGIFLVYQLVVATVLTLALLQALRSLANDLVDERRRFAIAVSILIPVTGLVTAIAESIEVWRPLHWSLPALQTAAMFALSFLFCNWVVAGGDAIFAQPRSEASLRQAPPEFSAADRIELARLRELIAAGALFDHGASVAQLARSAGLPEHRLRRLVNRGMGYRNFRALVNDTRIDEARRRLADPGRAREQMLTLSWDLGYDSLAPFNRAFRERTGTTPTEFRKAALEGAEALQSNPQISERN